MLIGFKRLFNSAHLDKSSEMVANMCWAKSFDFYFANTDFFFAMVFTEQTSSLQYVVTSSVVRLM